MCLLTSLDGVAGPWGGRARYEAVESPYVAKYLDEGKVGLVGGIYDVATGQVTFLGN